MAKYSGNFIQYSDKKVKDESKNLALYFITHITLYIVLLFFFIYFAWYTFFTLTHRFYAVSGPSMRYTLNRDISDTDTDSSYDGVYIDTTVSAKLFDIVVIRRPKSEKPIIKRVMALEGDYITIAKGKTDSGSDCYYFYRIASGSNLEEFDDEDAKFVEDVGANGYSIRGYEDWYKNSTDPTKNNYSGSPVQITVQVDDQSFTNSYEYSFYENFLNDYQADDENFYVSNNGLVYVKVPKGQFFYMGDNRGHSTDARVNGFENTKEIVGVTEFIVYNYNFGNRIWEVVKFYFNQVQEFFAR